MPENFPYTEDVLRCSFAEHGRLHQTLVTWLCVWQRPDQAEITSVAVVIITSSISLRQEAAKFVLTTSTERLRHLNAATLSHHFTGTVTLLDCLFSNQVERWHAPPLPPPTPPMALHQGFNGIIYRESMGHIFPAHIFEDVALGRWFSPRRRQRC